MKTDILSNLGMSPVRIKISEIANKRITQLFVEKYRGKYVCLGSEPKYLKYWGEVSILLSKALGGQT
jgi:hypothetical protein